MDKARHTAIIVLKEVNQDGKYANISLKEHLDRNRFDDRDASFITQLVYGTLENQAFIDQVLRKFAKMGKVNPWIENILRIGCYQILYLDRVPDSAACNESVKLCAKFGFKSLKGFVNGVLRNIARNKEELKSLKTDATDAKSLANLYGFPSWLVEMWIQEYGLENVRGIVKASVREGWITIRINKRKTYKEELVQKLEEQGVQVERGIYFDNALRVKGIGDIQSNPLYRQGLFTIQGESSMLVCQVLAPKPGEMILDACSAPGGKAIYLAELMDLEGKVYAFDIHEHRVELITKNRDRMDASIVCPKEQDATIFDPKMEQNMDRVLIDAPCSGWGVLHKKPDIKLRIKEENMDSLYRLQCNIIENCSRYLKVGGRMVYSTCTINPRENNDIVEGFLVQHPEFELEDFTEQLPDNLNGMVIKEGMVQLFPDSEGTDGFFIAKLRRTRL